MPLFSMNEFEHFIVTISSLFFFFFLKKFLLAVLINGQEYDEEVLRVFGGYVAQDDVCCCPYFFLLFLDSMKELDSRIEEYQIESRREEENTGMDFFSVGDLSTNMIHFHFFHLYPPFLPSSLCSLSFPGSLRCDDCP